MFQWLLCLPTACVTQGMTPREALPGSSRRTVSVLCFIRVVLHCRLFSCPGL